MPNTVLWFSAVTAPSTGIEAETAALAALTVNLSRLGTNPKCNMPLTSLQDHNGHAPALHSAKARADYAKRVLADIQGALLKAGYGTGEPSAFVAHAFTQAASNVN